MMSKLKELTDKEREKNQDRGARDDWEAIKLVIEAFPNLKQRVLRRISELRNRKRDSPINISMQDQVDYRRETKKKKPSK
jgi:hypothetical protein